MRLVEIEAARLAVSTGRQLLPNGPQDVSVSLQNFAVRRRQGLRRIILDGLARPALALLQKRNRRLAGVRLDSFIDDVAVGDRWATGAAWNHLLSARPASTIRRALVEGAHVGDGAVQRWLRLGVPEVHGVELFDMGAAWAHSTRELESAFGARVAFRQGSVDALPYEDGFFDAVSSEAVYEHVGNLALAAAESARVLKPGGIILHSIGPLYHVYCGDHCISAYGEEAGYDHLLLSEPEYRRRVEDRGFFDRQVDPRCNFWAVESMFSYARVKDYADAFLRSFVPIRVVAVISREAIAFRARNPDVWGRLVEAVGEQDLLVKALHIVLRRP